MNTLDAIKEYEFIKKIGHYYWRRKSDGKIFISDESSVLGNHTISPWGEEGLIQLNLIGIISYDSKNKLFNIPVIHTATENKHFSFIVGDYREMKFVYDNFDFELPE